MIDYKQLMDLYKKTNEDWHLEVSVCLTEPTCPIATIIEEGGEDRSYTCFGNTIEEAIENVINEVRKEIL
jgi:hypothetical protein